jgi:hypothetical protein
MLKPITQNRVSQFILWLVLAFALSGCLKVRVAIDVKPNGSGTIGIALGMTQQAKMLVSSQGGDPMQTLTENLSESATNPQDVKVTSWTEGEYEWVQGEVAFKDLNDLNERMSQVDYFESFSVTRQPGIFRDRFILNARLKPLMQDTNSSDISGFGDIDPSAFVEIQMAVRLPGDVIETNGVFGGADSSNMLWTVSSKQTITMQATSEAWNWINIGIAGGSVGLGILAIGGSVGLGILAIGGITLLAIPAKPKPRKNLPVTHATTDHLPGLPLSSSGGMVVAKKSPQAHTQAEVVMPIQPVSSISPAFPPGMLATIGARSLLQDVNQFLLKNTGSIRETLNELHMECPVLPVGKMQGIHIKLVSQQQVAVNGQVFPATHE